MPSCASYLFLQGPASLFFNRLAAALRDGGHQVWRINFNGGDRAFWRHPGAIDYVDGRCNFASFLTRRMVQWSITDIVLLGDCRPLHKIAIERARFFGVRTHIFEQGYIRPHWITLEHEGVNGFSSLPRDMSAYLQAAGELGAPPPPVKLPAKLPRRALDDVFYSLATMCMAWRYPKYERHWPYSQIEEYFYGGRRLIARMIRKHGRAREIRKIIRSGRKYFVFPLQVDVDSQIIFHSRYRSQAEVIHSVLESFARHAPGRATLVVTEHPLETSPTNWADLVFSKAASFGVASRVRFLAGGSPLELLQASSGIVVVNSTTGHLGLELGVPVIALGPAIFNMPRMTFQDGLDQFWRQARPADPRLVEAFRRVVIDRTQLNGDFFTRKGMALAVTHAIPRMLARRAGSPQPAPRNPVPSAYVRLAGARKKALLF